MHLHHSSSHSKFIFSGGVNPSNTFNAINWLSNNHGFPPQTFCLIAWVVQVMTKTFFPTFRKLATLPNLQIFAIVDSRTPLLILLSIHTLPTKLLSPLFFISSVILSSSSTFLFSSSVNLSFSHCSSRLSIFYNHRRGQSTSAPFFRLHEIFRLFSTSLRPLPPVLTTNLPPSMMSAPHSLPPILLVQYFPLLLSFL